MHLICINQRYPTLVALMMIALCAGCRGNFRDQKHPRLLTQSDVDFYLNQALESPAADTRRRAIGRIAQTDYVFEEPTLEALSAVAQSDASQSVRAAALHAMCRSTRRIVAMTAVEVLFATSNDESTVPVPDDGVRHAAIRALDHCVTHDTLDGKLADVAAGLGIELLGSDPSRNVRLAAAHLLGSFPREDVLRALVEALAQRDFGVCHEAEQSLSRLTGQSFDHNAVAWNHFIESTDDPFADRIDRVAEPDARSQGWWAMDWKWIEKDSR